MERFHPVMKYGTFIEVYNNYLYIAMHLYVCICIFKYTIRQTYTNNVRFYAIVANAYITHWHELNGNSLIKDQTLMKGQVY